MFRPGWVVLGSLLLSLSVTAAEPGIKIQFVGGTLPGLAKAGASLDLTSTDKLAIHINRRPPIQIFYPKVNTLEYGQNVNRRYAEAILLSPVFLLSKSRKHFITVGYEDADGKQQALVFRVEKGDIRSVLASLEARTGRRVEFTDQEARKTGK